MALRSVRNWQSGTRAWTSDTRLPPRRTIANRETTMEYISTRGSAPVLDFEGVTLAGLASDGGLYLPREWPRFSEAQIRDLRGLPYWEVAVEVMAPSSATA